MLDTHCHILPAVDDGSQSRDETLAMLAAAKSVGIDKVICTPHYKDDTFVEDDIFDAFDWFATVAAQEGVQAFLGYEIHWRKIEDFGVETVADYAIEGTDYAIVEFSAHHDIGQLEQRTLWKIKGSGITPIIAHPCRYASIQSNLTLAEDLKNAGCLLQMSADAVNAPLLSGQRKALKHMLGNGLYDYIASDAHCPEDYEFFAKAYQAKKMQNVMASQFDFLPAS